MAEKKISEELIEKKLSSFSNTQDSVQALSLWIMHNKAHHQKIVDTWLKVLRKSEVKHKLTLFYLCNDVVQHAKKKKALYYLENFKDNLREAAYVVREYDSIKPNVGRVFKIWEERRTYDLKFVKELKGILDGSGTSSISSSAKSTPVQVSPATYKPSSKSEKRKSDRHRSSKSSKHKEAAPEEPVKPVSPPEEAPSEEVNVPVGDFKPPAFLDEMTTLKKLEGEVNIKAKQLASLRIDATNIEAVKQLKDRSHGNEFCRQFEESCVKIEDYVAMLEREIKQRKVVLAYSEGAEDFYSEQFKEASIVANAYKNFGARVTNMKKRVDDMKKIIPATPSPVPSPTADAPSPGNSPSMLNIDDNETVDMDLDNEDGDASRQDPGSVMPGRAYTAMVKSISQPIASFTHIIMGNKDQASKAPVAVTQGVPPPTDTFQGSNILESRIANMLPNLARGSSSLGPSSQPPSTFTQQPSSQPPSTFTQQPSSQPPSTFTSQPPPSSVSQQPPLPVASPEPEIYSPSQPEPEIIDIDAGSSTPVMDEPDEKSPSPPPKAAPTNLGTKSETKTKTNPIDFLSQLLTKTNSSSSSSNFMQTLSLLTNTVKTNYQKQQDESETSNGDIINENDRQQLSTSPTSVAPVAINDSVQDRSWSGWKPIPPSQPPLPTHDPSAPPVLGQMKPSEPPPPLPQHPPRPPEPLPPQPYNMQNPSQDFSLPPPSIRQPVSQSYISPPPLLSNANPFPTPSVASSNAPGSFSVASVAASIAPPTMVTAPRPNMGFSPRYPFGGAVMLPTSDQPQVRPPLGQAPLLRPPLGQAPQPIGVAPPGFISRPGNTWEQRPPVPLPAAPLPPASPNAFPPPQKAFAPPPPPPVSNAPVWQQPPPPQPQNPPHQPPSDGFNQISSIPPQRPEWGADRQEYQQQNSWSSTEMEDTNNRDSGYQHPWDQPQSYDDDEDDNEYAEPSPVSPLPPPPKKSILRNSRTSSLREVTLVDETNSSSYNQDSITHLPVSEMKPAGILKKPSIDHHPANSQSSDVQSEFINILKQKSGANLPSVPPATRTLTSISPMDPVNADVDLHGEHGMGHGESISTIGVIGNSGRTSSVKSDDMEIDNEDAEGEYANEIENENTWEHSDGQHWVDRGNEQQQHVDHIECWEDRGQEDQGRHFHRRDSNPDQGNLNRPRWQEPRPQRHWQPRPSYSQEGFRPRSYSPRPRFDNYRGGPSPAKRPFFAPRPRMPYYRY